MGGGAILGIAATTFATAGALRDLLEAVILFNMAYSDFTLEQAGRSLMSYAREHWLLSGLALAALALAWQRRRADPVALLSLPLLPAGVLLASMSGRAYDDYYMALLPPLALLGGLAAHALRERAGAWTAPLLLATLALLFACDFALSLNPVKTEAAGRAYRSLDANQARRARLIQNLERLERLERLGTWLDRRSAAGDTVQLWNLKTQVYHFTERDAPTRFFFDAWALSPSPMLPRYAAEFNREIRRHPPRFILEGAVNVFYAPPPLDPARRAKWTTEYDFKPGTDPPTLLRPFFDFVADRYAVVCRLDDLTIYELKPTTTGPADCAALSRPASR